LLLRHLAVELDEGDDVHSGRQLKQVLLQPHQEIIGSRGGVPGLGLIDLAEGEGVPLPAVHELAVPRVAEPTTDRLTAQATLAAQANVLSSLMCFHLLRELSRLAWGERPKRLPCLLL
jgi:hypothetical protein